MPSCPSCGTRLVKKQTNCGVVYGCAACGGRAAALPVLRKAGATREFVRDVWLKARSPDAPRVRRCPHCNRRMSQVRSGGGGKALTLDVCKPCASIWFDAAEFETVPRTRPASPAIGLSPEARQQAAILEAKAIGERYDREQSTFTPDKAWHWLPGLLGLPIEQDAPQLSKRPWVTWGIVAATVLLMIGVFRNLENVVNAWGFIPAEWGRRGGLTMLTSFFLHGGIFHLVGNMYFLLVFGDNVEDHLGKGSFVLLLFTAHAAGMVAHGAFDPRSTVPCVGASAGISGVIAYYAIAFPNVRLGFLFRYFFYFRWFRMPAYVALILFVLVQSLGAWFQIKGFSHVSYLAHIGGLSVGMATGLALYLCRRRSTRAALGDASETVALGHMRGKMRRP